MNDQTLNELINQYQKDKSVMGTGELYLLIDYLIEKKNDLLETIKDISEDKHRLINAIDNDNDDSIDNCDDDDDNEDKEPFSSYKEDLD